MGRMILSGTVFVLAAFCFIAPGWAQHQHGAHPPAPAAGGEGKKAEPMAGDESSPRRTFLLDDAVKISFIVTPMAEHRKMLREMRMKDEGDRGASHNIAVSLTDARSNLPLNEAVAKMKVVSPAGKEEIKTLDRIPAMNQYSADFTLAEKGRYEILILVKSREKRHAAGFYYQLK